MSAINAINKYSINLMWINSTLNPQQDKLLHVLNNGHRIEPHVDSTLYDSLIEWSKANPEAAINLWYDGASTKKSTVRMIKLSLDYIANIYLKDIRTLPIVLANPDIFSDCVPVYERIDFLKIIIIIDAIECQNEDAAIFSDIQVGDKRPIEKSRRMNKAELFDEETMRALNEQGLVLNSGTHAPVENQFLLLTNHPLMIQALKEIAINLVMARIIHNLNNKILWYHSELTFFSNLVIELPKYFLFLKGELRLTYWATGKPYNSQTDGLYPFGVTPQRSGPGRFQDRLLKYSDPDDFSQFYIHDEQKPGTTRAKYRLYAREVHVRAGNNHPEHLNLDTPPTGGEYYQCRFYKHTGLKSESINSEENQARREILAEYRELTTHLQPHQIQNHARIH